MIASAFAAVGAGVPVGTGEPVGPTLGSLEGCALLLGSPEGDGGELVGLPDALGSPDGLAPGVLVAGGAALVDGLAVGALGVALG
ncbi:MAG: hypothetical protein QOF11_1006, partial [Chloroflexota bacterium]|nr:hypothetical protein [Chloroflexota bacterium]